jgi:hypothetical protein
MSGSIKGWEFLNEEGDYQHSNIVVLHVLRILARVFV